MFTSGTPVLIHPKSGQVVLNVTSGPVPGTYKGDTLEGPKGALTQFQKAIFDNVGSKFNSYGQTIVNLNDFNTETAKLKRQYNNVQGQKSRLRPGTDDHKLLKEKSNRLAKELADRGMPPKTLKAPIKTLSAMLGLNERSELNRTKKRALEAAKISCGWTWKQGLTGRYLQPSKHSEGICKTEDKIQQYLASGVADYKAKRAATLRIMPPRTPLGRPSKTLKKR